MTILLLTLAGFVIAMVAMAIGVMVTGRRLPEPLSVDTSVTELSRENELAAVSVLNR